MKSYDIKINITPELHVDMKKYGELYCVGLASQVRDELNEEALYAFAQFYEDYSPTSYDRHYFNFMDNVHRGYYRNPHGSIVRGGVELNPAWMAGVYNESVDTVFNTVILGYHGPAGEGIAPMSPNPLEILLEKRDEIAKGIKKYKKYGNDRAKTGSYNTLRLK